jgi:hypothetical protein
MADRSHLQPPKHDPRAWDNDDNKPVIPKIPGPRAPRTTTEDRYTFASAVADCPVHRARHMAFEAERTEDAATLDRMNRRLLRQLDLRFSSAARATTQ